MPFIYECIYCGNKNVHAITNDGGSVQFCEKCNKMYKAKQINEHIHGKNCECKHK